MRGARGFACLCRMSEKESERGRLETFSGESAGSKREYWRKQRGMRGRMAWYLGGRTWWNVAKRVQTLFGRSWTHSDSDPRARSPLALCAPTYKYIYMTSTRSASCSRRAHRAVLSVAKSIVHMTTYITVDHFWPSIWVVT